MVGNVPARGQVGVEPARLEIEGAVAGRGRRIGRRLAGERVAEVVLGREQPAHLRLARGVVEAVHRPEVAAVDRHAGARVDPGPLAAVEHLFRPGIGAAVLPGDRRPERPACAETDERRQLAGQADGLHRAPPVGVTGAGELRVQRRERGAGGGEPVGGVLLGLAGCGGVGRKPGARGREHGIVTERHDLDRRRAKVEAEVDAAGAGCARVHQRSVLQTSAAAASVASMSSSLCAKDTNRFSNAPGWKRMSRSSMPSHQRRNMAWSA